MVRYLVAGAAGLLGSELLEVLDGRTVTALDRSALDITDRAAVMRAVAGHDVVVNASAYTRVDDAESDEDTAFAVNAQGAENLAAAAAAGSARFVQVSTDYVFDGASDEPYPEDATPNPVSAYGRSKAAGERLSLAANPGATYVVRTAWLYGGARPNFASKMLELARTTPTWKVVDDQVGQPTWSRDVAHQIVALVDADVPPGIYHATNAGETSWYGFARELLALSGYEVDRIQPTSSSDFPRPAPRPPRSVLGHDRWAAVGLTPMRSWQSAAAAAIASGAVA